MTKKRHAGWPHHSAEIPGLIQLTPLTLFILFQNYQTHTRFKLVYLRPVSISGPIEASGEFLRPNAEYILDWM